MMTIAPQSPVFGRRKDIQAALTRQLDRIESHRLLPAHRNPPPLAWDDKRALWVPSDQARNALYTAATQLDWELQRAEEEGQIDTTQYRKLAGAYEAAGLLTRPGIGVWPRLSLGLDRDPETDRLFSPLVDDPMHGFYGRGELPELTPHGLASARRWVGRAFGHQASRLSSEALTPVARKELRRGRKDWGNAARWHERHDKAKRVLSER
ncbi:MAG: hypothetical protein AB7P76_04330 [Candidatus Melainabacteria bacterium]